MTSKLFAIIFIKVGEQIITINFKVIFMWFKSDCFDLRQFGLYIFRAVVVTVADFNYFELCFAAINCFFKYFNQLELKNCFIKHFGFEFSFITIDYFFLHSFQIHQMSKNQMLSTILYQQIYSSDLFLIKLYILFFTNKYAF